MPDPNVTTAAIETHAAALHGAIGRHAANASRCKVWSGAIVTGLVLLAAGKAQMGALPWAAGVVVLLALAEAGQVALARFFTEAYNRFMAKVPLNGGNLPKAEEWLVLPAPVLGWRQAGLVLRALGSFSVWPFYAALLALLVTFHVQTSPSAAEKSHSAAKPAPASVKSTVPMSVLSAPTPRPSQPSNATGAFPNGPAKPPGNSTQPRPPQPQNTFTPGKPATPPAAIRYPGIPPARPPQNTNTPPSALPPQNATPPQNGAPPANGAVPPTGAAQPGGGSPPPPLQGAAPPSAPVAPPVSQPAAPAPKTDGSPAPQPAAPH